MLKGEKFDAFTLFRQWFISKVVNRKDCQAEQVKHEYPMIIVMNGTMPRDAS